ncbi:MAG: PIN domain-containing protein [Thermoplasmata archaeon]|nr:PIN domain-containing protein [Thermoplasmata archaeon]
MTGGSSGLIYFDTSALIAFSDKRDRNHDSAKNYFQTEIKRGSRFVLGRHIIIKYIDGVTKRVSKRKAIEQLGYILSSKLYFIEKYNEDDWANALQYFKKYNDKPIDLTDCISFTIMDRLGLKTAFTFDKDFKTHGFKIAP